MTQDESGEFGQKRALQEIQSKRATDVATIRANATVEAAKLRGRRLASSNAAAAKLLTQSASQAIYDEIERNAGITFTEAERKQLISVGEASEYRRQGWLTDDTLRLFNVLKLFRDPLLGGLMEGAMEQAIGTQKMLEEKTKPAVKQSQSLSADRIKFIDAVIQKGYSRQEAEKMADERGVK